MRNIKFQTEYYYHVYNRGVDKRKIFMDKDDYLRFLWGIKNLNNDLTHEERIFRKNQEKCKKELSPEASGLSSGISERQKWIEIICYCLIPSHFHFLIKQVSNKGIPSFMQKLSLSYTNYFNAKYKRSGSLFQGTYKAKEIKSDHALLYISAYIHGNPEIHKIAKADIWPWSSYPDYIGKRNGRLNKKDLILKEFKNKEDYKNYLNFTINNSSEIKEELKNCILE